MKRAEEIVFSNLCHDDNLEFVVIDDSVCKKYGTHSEMVCYNHSTTLGMYSAMTMLQPFTYLVISTFHLL